MRLRRSFAGERRGFLRLTHRLGRLRGRLAGARLTLRLKFRRRAGLRARLRLRRRGLLCGFIRKLKRILRLGRGLAGLLGRCLRLRRRGLRVVGLLVRLLCGVLSGIVLGRRLCRLTGLRSRIASGFRSLTGLLRGL